jgi:hypothetical protein
MDNQSSEPHPASRDFSPVDPDADSHAFIIRIWLEDVESAAGVALWRGHITHVLDRRRRYFQDLPSIIHFVAPYLEEWGMTHKP